MKAMGARIVAGCFALADEKSTRLSEYADGELARLVRAGDSDAFAELTGRYMSLIRFKAAPFHSTQLETDDLCQEGLLGLLNAARTYDAANGAAFRTYAGVCVANRMIMAYRSALSRKNEPLSNFVSLSGDEGGLALGSDGLDPEDVLASSESVDLLWRRIRSVLSDQELRVLKLYLSGYSYAEIAGKLAIAPKAADNALQRARTKLKSRFNG